MTKPANRFLPGPWGALGPLAGVAAFLLALLGCSRPSEQRPSEQRPSEQRPSEERKDKPAPAQTELTVFAAASLGDAFRQLEPAFRESTDGAKVVFHFAGTQELRTQIEQGAQADVFASADQRHMDALWKAGLVEPAQDFATNELVVVVAKSGPEVQSLEQLPWVERLVLGAPEVPIGRYSLEVFERARARYGADFAERVEKKVVSRELNVKQVLAKVRLGEADAGLVYRSDVRPGPDAPRIVTIPAEFNVIARYPIALVKATGQPELARKFLALTLSPAGQAILVRAGFGERGEVPPPR